MTRAHFRFATDILRRLGEELNPSLDQGVLELVKNAYDADAPSCTIELRDVDQPGGTLRIEDTGEGMPEDQIIDSFLVLGRSSKDPRARTPSGRIPAGSKGLGRLAALRSGARVILVTRPAAEPKHQFRLVIDWRAYELASVVDQVDLVIERQPRTKGRPNGTEIVVEGLRQPIRRGDVRRLARSLLLLVDPFGGLPSSFSAELIAPEFTDLEKLVRSKYFDAAEYHLTASVDRSGQAAAAVLDWRGSPLFGATHADLRATGTPYACPPSKLEFWAFKLDGTTFQSRSSSLSEVKVWLREFGGVFLYLNGLRVVPYGDPGNDWLDLNLRRSQRQEERPSTNNSIGRLVVSDPDLRLVAKTDRSGLIENDVLGELRQFATDALEWMARERLKVAEKRRRAERGAAPKRSEKKRDRVKQAIEHASGDEQRELQEAFRDYDRARERELESLHREVQLYRTLSTAGITAATFAHETSGGPLKVVGRAVATLRRRVKVLPPGAAEPLGEPIAAIQEAARSLSVFSATTLSLVDRDKRRVGQVNANEVVQAIITTYEPFLRARDVKVKFHGAPGHPKLHGSVAALESVVVNLLNNSLTALTESKDDQREVELVMEVEGSSLMLRFADNGPGIRDVAMSDIWLPGVTTRPGGTGLGLTIVRDTVADLGGDVRAEDTKRGGAVFVVELPILGGSG